MSTTCPSILLVIALEHSFAYTTSTIQLDCPYHKNNLSCIEKAYGVRTWLLLGGQLFQVQELPNISNHTHHFTGFCCRNIPCCCSKMGVPISEQKTAFAGHKGNLLNRCRFETLTHRAYQRVSPLNRNPIARHRVPTLMSSPCCFCYPQTANKALHIWRFFWVLFPETTGHVGTCTDIWLSSSSVHKANQNNNTNVLSSNPISFAFWAEDSCFLVHSCSRVAGGRRGGEPCSAALGGAAESPHAADRRRPEGPPWGLRRPSLVGGGGIVRLHEDPQGSIRFQLGRWTR